MRIAVIVVGLLLGVGIAAWQAVPGLLDSDAVRGRIERSLGRRLDYERVDLGLSPLSLTFVRPVLASSDSSSPASGESPAFEADRLELRLLPGAVLTGGPSVESVLVRSATLRVLYSGDAGLTLPVLPLLGGRLDLEGGTLVIEAGAASPPIRWELANLVLRVDGRPPGEPLDFEAAGDAASGGRVEVSGRIAPDGKFEVRLRLDEVSLSPLAPFVAGLWVAAGVASGDVEATGSSAGVETAHAAIALRRGNLRLDEIGLRGDVGLEAALEEGPGGAGRFDVDATGAEVTLGDVRVKERGQHATVSGRLVAADGSLGVDEVRLRMEKVDVRAGLGQPR